MDFGLLPPEINSGRMYAGPGSGPMFAAAAAWDALAADLHSTAASYSSVISGLTAGWQGPSSVTMAAAVAPYLAWMRATAAQAEQTAAQARAAVTAYETAFVTTVPPPMVAANRSLLMSLIATNFLGQNTPAIAATEAQYAEMWAQDAAAMYGYAGQSATAAQLTPFGTPPQTANPAGATGQAAVVAQASGAQAAPRLTTLASAVPQTLQNLAAPAAAAPAQPFTPAEIFETVVSSFLNGTIGANSPVKIYGPLGSFYDLGVESFVAPFNNYNMQVAYGQAISGAASAAVNPGSAGGLTSAMRMAGSAGGAVSAGMGHAELVGTLSVPQGWASAAPAIRPIATVLPQTGLGAFPSAAAADGQSGLFGNMALSSLAGRAVAGSGSVAAGPAGGTGAAAGVAASTATTATIIVINDD